MQVGTVFELRYDRWCGWLLCVLGMGRPFTRVRVGDAFVDVRMGWSFHATVPRDRIRRAVEADRPFVGWGVHGWRGRWLVNGSLQGLVAIEIDPPICARVLIAPVRLRTLYISLVDPDGFRAALAS